VKLAISLVLAAVLAAGCAGAHYGAGLVPGESSIDDVRASMGEPTVVHELDDGGEMWWYSKLPNGRENYAAHIDPDGWLVSFEQRLKPEFIARLRPNESTAADVFATLGPPYRKFKHPAKDRESWEYPLWTTPDTQTLFVDLSSDLVVREVYQLYDRDRGRSGLFFGFGGFSIGR
jgi:hypothetical protein